MEASLVIANAKDIQVMSRCL